MPKETSDQVLDRAALAAYRRRIAELEEELDDARAAEDLARAERATDRTRARCSPSFAGALAPAARARTLGAGDSERARKAVSARIRDAIDRIEAVHPELASHLDRSISTGISLPLRAAGGVTPRGPRAQAASATSSGSAGSAAG